MRTVSPYRIRNCLVRTSITIAVAIIVAAAGFAQPATGEDPCGWREAVQTNIAQGMKMEVETRDDERAEGYFDQLHPEHQVLIVSRTPEFYAALDTIPLWEISKIRYWESTEAHPERTVLIGLAGFAAGVLIGVAIEGDFQAGTGLTLGGLGLVGAVVAGSRIPSHHTLRCEPVRERR